MKDNVYSPKEILVFQGFSKLIEEGISINNIRVSDIAKAAGIGKGTVYEYFKSKEEVIAKSIFYQMQMEFMGILEKSNKVDGFKSKCYLGFQEIIELMTKKMAYLQLLLTSKEIHEVFKCLNGGMGQIVEFRDFILDIIEPTIKLGIEEKIINPELEKEYIQSVFITVCSGLSTIVHFKLGELTNEDIKRHKEIAYEMLVKSLK